MKSIDPSGSLFSFEVRDPCVKECRPLIDPLPPFMEAKPVSSPSSSFKVNTIGFYFNPETRSESASGSSKSVITLNEQNSCIPNKAGTPAGSPSFARRPIANGHFQRRSFKPSIRIHQPPGGFDQIGQ